MEIIYILLALLLLVDGIFHHGEGGIGGANLHKGCIFCACDIRNLAGKILGENNLLFGSLYFITLAVIHFYILLPTNTP